MITQTGLDLIKKFEGRRLTAYKCPAGVWTIGYGSTRIGGQAVRPGMMITEDQADSLLREDAEAHLEKAVQCVLRPDLLSQSQIDALASFVFNVGVGAFRGSTMLKKINVGDMHGAADEFGRWDKANGKPLTGLKRRRAAERELFLS